MLPLAKDARQTAIARSQYQAEIDHASRTAAAAGPLAEAKAQQAVLAEQALVAARNAELREAELVAEVIKPAQAEAEKVRIAADAAAHATKVSAEAAAAEDRIALDQRIIDQLPELVRAAAEGLQGAQVTVFNGAAGVNDVMTQLVGQGLSILDTVRANLRQIEPPASPGLAPADVIAAQQRRAGAQG